MTNKIKILLREALSKISEGEDNKVPVEDVFYHDNAHKNGYNREVHNSLPTDFTDEYFENTPETKVDVKRIVPTQAFVTKSNLSNVDSVGVRTGAHLVKSGDIYYIIDGHHRIANNIIKGVDVIYAHVVDSLL